MTNGASSPAAPDYRVAVLAELDRASVDPQCATFIRAIYREDAEALRHELSLEGIDVPDAPALEASDG